MSSSSTDHSREIKTRQPMVWIEPVKNTVCQMLKSVYKFLSINVLGPVLIYVLPEIQLDRGQLFSNSWVILFTPDLSFLNLHIK